MGGTYLYDPKSGNALDKIDSNNAEAEESSKKRAEARAAKNEERAKRREGVIQQIEKHVQAAVEYRMV